MLLFYCVGKLLFPLIFVGKLLVVVFVGNLTGRRFSVGNFVFSQSSSSNKNNCFCGRSPRQQGSEVDLNNLKDAKKMNLRANVVI